MSATASPAVSPDTMPKIPPVSSNDKHLFWHEVNGAYSPSSSFRELDPCPTFFTLDDFAQIDERLVSLLESEKFDALGQKRSYPVSGLELYLARMYWSNPPLTLPVPYPAANGKKAQYQVEAINALTWAPDSEYVTADIWFWVLKFTHDDIAYPVHSQQGSVSIPKAWLDEKYPSWDQRYIVGREMELSRELLTQFIIEPKLAVHSDALPDLSFD